MTPRYAIVAQDYHTGREIELCTCNNNPEAVARAVRNKRRKGKLAYVKVRVIDREAGTMTYEEAKIRGQQLFDEFHKAIHGEYLSAVLMALRALLTSVAADMSDEDREALARIMSKSIQSAPELMDAVEKEARHAH